MEIFAAGNKYKVLEGTIPCFINGRWFVNGYKWIKSRQEYSKNFGTFNVGPHYEEIGTMSSLAGMAIKSVRFLN